MCPYHPEQTFGTREMYSEHIAQRHSERQDKLLKLDEIDKNAQLTPRPQSGCPLCSYEAETWVDMDKHLAFHLETLALLSLPLATGLERDDVRMESLQLEGGEDDVMQLLDGNAAGVLSSLFKTEGELVDEDGNQLPQGERITLAALEDLDSKTLALASEDSTDWLWDAATGTLQKTPIDAKGLSWAAENGHEAIVKLLLETGKVDVDLKDSGGETPLLKAAGSGHEAVVKLLLEKGAQLETKSSSGRTPLSWAAGGGHLTVVERLLQEKTEVNAAAGYSGGRTALQAAAEGGHLAVVERLLQEKVEVNAAAGEDNRRTALQAAAGGGHLAVVERLLQEKAEANAAAVGYGGRTALQAAAGGGHLAVVERLLQEKAEVNAAAGEDGGRTALQAAAGRGHLAVMECLHQAGAVN